MRLRFSVPLFFFCCVFVHGVFAGPFPPPGMTLPEYWGEEHVWWDGRAAFHGEVVRPACTLAMEDAWQIIDMGKPRYGIYRMVFPDLKENSASGSGTVNLTVRVGTFSLIPG